MSVIRWLLRLVAGLLLGGLVVVLVLPLVGSSTNCGGATVSLPGGCETRSGLPVGATIVVCQLLGVAMMLALGIWADRRHP